ncbi:MAG: hypothetical protein V1816_04485 [Pseudomonadota bacterium]
MRIKAILVLMIFLFPGPGREARAEWEDMVGKSPIWNAENSDHLFREHAWSLKAGYHFFSGSGYTDAWKIDPRRLNSLAFEASYERVVWTYLGLELGAGYWGVKKKSTNAIHYTDAAKLDLNNVYLAPTVKGILPLTNHWAVYAGGGADLYYSWAEQTYVYGLTGRVKNKTQRLIPGWHVLAGTEIYIMPNPGGQDVYDWPVGLFVEYKYSQAVWPNMDEDIIGRTGRSSSHDLNLGGHWIFCGLRFHI